MNIIKKIFITDKRNNTGSENTGNYNSGNYNSGNHNSGDYNSGYRNSGDYNSGNHNSGNCNSGYRNSGYRNSGDYNSGYRNSGNCNSGDYNSGYRNSGNCNSGNCNSGWFNRNEPKMRMFEKESEYTYSEFREKFGYEDISLPICAWINKEDMTDEEKKLNTSWKTTGGYLKTLGYKEAWAKAWSEASETQKNWYKSLPNFDAIIFKDITGIDIATKETIKIGDQTYDKAEVENALKNVKSIK